MLVISAPHHPPPDQSIALTRAEADDLAAALFADPGVMSGAAGLAAWLMAAARDLGAGQGAANDNAAIPVRPLRTGLSGLWLGVVVSLAYLAVVASTWLEVNP